VLAFAQEREKVSLLDTSRRLTPKALGSTLLAQRRRQT
jgi:hypothetical protein